MRFRNFCFTITFFCISFSLSAQKEDYQWALGGFGCPTCYYRFFYDFNTDPPSIVLRADSMNTADFMASISSPEGAILAYSNGLRILNAAGKTIENSEGLNPLYSSSQFTAYPNPASGFFLRKPGNSNILYLIHLEHDSHPMPSNTYGIVGRNLLLTTIDLSLNNGQGKVVSKNEIILDGVFTTPKAVRHANGRDWWIFISDADKNQHFRFLLTPDGLSGPWTQLIGTKPSPVGLGNSLGSTFSPSGRYYIDFNVFTGFGIFDFDRCTGLLSNEHRVNYNYHPSPTVAYGEGGGVAFSPNDRYLYVSLTKEGVYPSFPAFPFVIYRQPYMVQYDLNAPDLAAAGDTVNYIPDTLTLENYNGDERLLHSAYGPDGQLYVVYEGGGFSTIHYPNAGGTACDFRYNNPFFDNTVFWGLPNLPNYRLGPVDGSTCDTLGINNVPVANFRTDDTLGLLSRLFYDLSYYEPAEWQWSFGDGSFSADTSPIHQYAQPGLYQVCLIVSNAYGADTLCRQIAIGVSATLQPQQDFVVNVFPNPVSEQLHIESTLPWPEKATLSWFDVLGRKSGAIALPPGAKSVSLAVGALPPGLYGVVGRVGNRVLFQKTVVVQR
ncbi:MAG: PKD domain-containing protein [Saprospiraceae bacterium]